MKATITKEGILSIEAETDIESYALIKWTGDVMAFDRENSEEDRSVYLIDGSKILISTGIE